MIRRAALGALLALATAGGARAGEEKKAQEAYLRLPAVTATLVRASGRGVLTAEAGVDTPDPKLRARVALLQPRLQDAYNGVLAGFAATLAPGALPDVETLVQRLQAATDRVVGRPGARVLIGSVLAD